MTDPNPNPTDPTARPAASSLEELLAPYAGTELSVDEVLVRLAPADRARLEGARDAAEALLSHADTSPGNRRGPRGRRH